MNDGGGEERMGGVGGRGGAKLEVLDGCCCFDIDDDDDDGRRPIPMFGLAVRVRSLNETEKRFRVGKEVKGWKSGSGFRPPKHSLHC